MALLLIVSKVSFWSDDSILVSFLLSKSVFLSFMSNDSVLVPFLSDESVLIFFGSIFLEFLALLLGLSGVLSSNILDFSFSLPPI